jgi:hypothetical protein
MAQRHRAAGNMAHLRVMQRRCGRKAKSDISVSKAMAKAGDEKRGGIVWR